MERNYSELYNLLNGGLPLDKVGPRLRQAARRALLSQDIGRMRAVVRAITAELQRRGALPRQPAAQGSPIGLDHTLEAMQLAQDLQVGGPHGGQVLEVLEATLDLLLNFIPETDLKILLFGELGESENPHRVFVLDVSQPYPRWIDERSPGFSVSIPSAAGLPAGLATDPGEDSDHSLTLAVPLHAPSDRLSGQGPAREAGLLFLPAREGWPTDSSLKLGAKLSQFVTQRWQVHQDVNQMIHVDALTGLFNRRFLDAHFPLLLERAKRNRTPLSLVIADIDLFKSINTEYGLTVGDQVLQMVARRLKEEVRKVDVVCRRGGEEFAIILPEADHQAVKEVITRLLNASYRLETSLGDQAVTIIIRLSFGVTTFPDNGSDDLQLHTQAEYLMLLAKNQGRHRCYYYSKDGDHLVQLPAMEARG